MTGVQTCALPICFQPSDPALYSAFNYVVTNIPLLNNNAYHGVEITAVKGLSHKLQVLGGFTIQRQKGVYGRGFSDQATSDNFTDPNYDINRSNNYLNLDSTYVFKLDATYELPWKIGTSYAVAFSGDGRLLATLGRDVSLWDLALRSKVVRAHPFSHPSDAAFSPDQRHLAVRSTSGQIAIVDVR